MDDAKLKELYTRWCQDETGNTFDKDNLPAGIELAVDLLTKLDPLEFDITSEKLSDMSTTYATNEEGIPLKVLRWLKPYYRLRSL